MSSTNWYIYNTILIPKAHFLILINVLKNQILEYCKQFNKVKSLSFCRHSFRSGGVFIHPLSLLPLTKYKD